MNEMQLYKLLQDHVGVLNALVVALYNGQVTAADAAAQAQKKIEQTLASLNQ